MNYNPSKLIKFAELGVWLRRQEYSSKYSERNSASVYDAVDYEEIQAKIQGFRAFGSYGQPCGISWAEKRFRTGQLIKMLRKFFIFC